MVITATHLFNMLSRFET